MKIRIDFGGFYYTTHEAMIDNMVEYQAEDFDKFRQDINLSEFIDYPKTFQNYIESYCEVLGDEIFYEYDTNISFKNIRLDSPKYYNFETDIIYCDVLKKDQTRLNKILLKEPDFLRRLKEATKSYDGYISFYNYDEVVNNKDNILHQFVYGYICPKFDRYDNIEFNLVYRDEAELIEYLDPLHIDRLLGFNHMGPK